MFEQELLDKCIGEYLQKAKRRRPAAGEEEEEAAEEEEGLVRPLFEDDDEDEGVGVAGSPLKRTRLDAPPAHWPILLRRRPTNRSPSSMNRLDDPPILLEDAGRTASIEA